MTTVIGLMACLLAGLLLGVFLERIFRRGAVCRGCRLAGCNKAVSSECKTCCRFYRDNFQHKRLRGVVAPGGLRPEQPEDDWSARDWEAANFHEDCGDR